MIIILGTPGAGKTTQSRLLAEYLDCPWFSMGELIRQHSSGQARKDMLAGKIIDDEATFQIIEKALEPLDTANKEFIVEGNPRSIPQAQWWIDKLKSGQIKQMGVIHLIAPAAIAKGRIAKRGRLDDHDDGVIEKRFEEYYRSITPTLDYLTQNGVAVHQVDASGGIEEVAASIKKALRI